VRVAAAWAFNLMMVGVTLGCLLLVRHVQQMVQLSSVVLINIVVINLLNRVIWNLLQWVIEIEQSKTKTEAILSIMNKSYLAQSCNVIVLPMLMNLAFASDLDGPAGLAGAVHDYQITAFLFMLVFNLLNVPHRLAQLVLCLPCLRRLAIWYHLRAEAYAGPQGARHVFLSLYEPPRLPIAGLYVYITATANQAFFFCHLQPVLLFYLLFNLATFYLANRHMLLRMCKMPDLIDYFIFENVILYALNIPLFYALGSITFLELRGENWVMFVPSWLCLVIWFMASQNPFNVARALTKAIVKLVDPDSVDQYRAPKTDEEQQDIEATVVESANGTRQQRKESYFSHSPMTVLFNFEYCLVQSPGIYHNKLKRWCESFHTSKRT
jgi:hypothetical protein